MITLRSLLRGASRLVRKTVLGPAPKLFDPEYYLAAHPGVAASGLDPYLHYATVGWRRGYDPAASFDGAYYRLQVPELKGDPLLHYMRVGAALGLDPSPDFGTAAYRDANPDIQATNPLLHYLLWGRAEGRKAHPAGHLARLDEARRTIEVSRRSARRVVIALDAEARPGEKPRSEEIRVKLALATEEIVWLARAIAWFDASPDPGGSIRLDIPLDGDSRPDDATALLTLAGTCRRDAADATIRFETLRLAPAGTAEPHDDLTAATNRGGRLSVRFREA